MKALGEVNLRSIRVGERLLLIGAVIGAKAGFQGALLTHATSSAIDAEGLQAQEFLLEPGVHVGGGVDLRHAAIGVLHDDPATRPDHLYLDGLTYQALSPRLSADRRLGWLARDPGGHQPQPYEQLAAHYTAIGQPGQARDVLYARERIQRLGKGPASSSWSLLQDITVGFGYRPLRALGWLALLGQKYAFNPRGLQQWLSYFLIAAGWTLTTTVATGLARVLRRG